ncbi:MAG: glycosyl transferase group 1 [Frankiales bacterium]|nr:glycosyl transferase group 1 [Frankiales bacterium]
MLLNRGSMRPVRVGLDATPLLGRPTGVGRYVEGLLGGLSALRPAPELVLTAFTLRGAGDLASLAEQAGAGAARTSGRRIPARALQAAWQRTSLPPVELLSGRVDVFHGTNFLLPPARRAAGVVTVHDLAYLRYPELVSPASRRYAELVPRALRRGALVLTPSRAVADEVVAEYRLDPDRVLASGLGVDRSWFEATPLSPAELAAAGLPERYVLFVGNREPRKNLPVLVDAHAALRRADPETPPLVLVGPAGWGDPLTASSDHVVTAGYLGGEQLRRVLAGASCLAFPSQYEGFGLPPLEALAAGVPVVASDLPVTREVLGSHAELAGVGDVDQLAAALQRVLARTTDPEPGRAWAAQWTWRRCAERTMQVYEAARAG